ncbi:MAG: DUF1573 domain-containing protein [Prevotellaceae bacterium]|jgi:hypothetical protein|nr:DUF1573 domain-containing protein [Prevotellaceae bacterium]
MKKVLSILVCALMVSTVTVAQEQEKTDEKKGTISFEKTVHDFGEVKEEIGKATYEFEFTNTGEAPILISNVTATCGCTVPSWTKEPVLPSKKGSVTVGYSTIGRIGLFVKSLTVINNGDSGNITLQIKGTVLAKPKPEPTN